MSRITFNSNIAALKANRRVGESSRALGISSERLSSGFRINRAADDAAGLSVADLLRTDIKVSNQAIRNANDAISLINVADGAVKELSSILIRINELATQSANETLGTAERSALQDEVDALRDEYNRIVESTEFNDLKLTDGTLGSVSIQLGYGTTDTVAFQSGDGLERASATGTFTGGLGAGGSGDIETYLIDLEGDGDLDQIAGFANDNAVTVNYNDGAGNVESNDQISLDPLGGNLTTLAVGDIDHDGFDDIITGDDNGEIYFFQGDGSSFDGGGGTLLSTPGSVVTNVQSGFDLDGDLKDDISYSAAGRTMVLLSTEGYAIDHNYASENESTYFDFDGDGDLDSATSMGANGNITIYENDGAGGFSSFTTVGVANKGTQLRSGDFDNNGYDDIIAVSSGSIQIITSDGVGGFSVSGLDSTGTFSFSDVQIADQNQDGNLDLIYAGTTNIGIRYGIGDGTFGGEITSTATVSSSTSRIAVGDLNGDGVADIASSPDGETEWIFADTVDSALLEYIDISTRDDALASMSTIDAAMQRVAAEQGALGAAMSRLETAVSELFTSRDELSSAESSIRDADVASESARLIKNQILNETALSVLAQANLLPEIGLSLLESA